MCSARLFCRPDIQAFCGSARPDHNGQLACLRAHRDRLSEPCRKEELKFSIMEASDLRLIPALTHACTAGENSNETQEVGLRCLFTVLVLIVMTAALRAAMMEERRLEGGAPRRSRTSGYRTGSVFRTIYRCYDLMRTCFENCCGRSLLLFIRFTSVLTR